MATTYRVEWIKRVATMRGEVIAKDASWSIADRLDLQRPGRDAIPGPAVRMPRPAAYALAAMYRQAGHDARVLEEVPS